MVLERKSKKKQKWIEKWRSKYRLVFITDDTLEERFTFRLSRLNVFVALGTLTIVLIILTSILIAFTPLREYIPGYTNVGLTRKIYILQAKADSIERELAMKDQFLTNIRNVISGKELSDQMPRVADSMKRYSNITLKRSAEDSLLRLEMENQSSYNLNRLDAREAPVQKKAPVGSMLFFTPLKGVVTSEFNMAERHYGVDIAARKNEAVKAVLDGTVILTNWTLETGYVMTIQHAGSVISVYKHNSVLLKKTGDMVNAGDPVAIVGETGELTSGPHLHFELWNNGSPVNPKDYINF